MCIASIFVALVVACAGDAGLLAEGDHTRSLDVGGRKRTYLVHVPKGHDSKKPCALVLAFHGAGMNAVLMSAYSGLNKKADDNDFLVVYPNGTGRSGFLTWNCGGFQGSFADGRPDDVEFTTRMIDELESVVAVDPKRVYATGISNGGMMCYRLGAELAQRIAAIAPVAGALAIEKVNPSRPVPALVLHGTEDTFVPFNGPDPRTRRLFKIATIDDSVRAWALANGCPETPAATDLPDRAPDDGTTVKRFVYGPGRDGAEVILLKIIGGGHTWPGQSIASGAFLGRSTRDISANDVIWDFFIRHPMK